MRDIAVISFAQAPSVRRDIIHNEVEILMPVVAEAVASSGLTRDRIGFTVSGSCDYLAGVPFSFVMALDGVGAWPPIEESHVEMDGAWALAEAWTRLQRGDIDTALVFGFGKSSVGELPDVLSLQLDPYLVAPLWPDSISIAALQARAMIDAGLATARGPAWRCAAERTQRPIRSRNSRATFRWTSCSPSRRSRRRFAATTARRSPTEPRQSFSRAEISLAHCARRPDERRRGFGASTIASTHSRSAAAI